MLQDKALLVKLSISLPGNSRKDAGVTANTLQREGMANGSGRWLKQIFPDEGYKPLVELSGEIRTWHYEHTLPWSDEGYRLLPTAMYAEYTDKMRKFHGQFDDARDSFLRNLPEHEKWARKAHNGSFDSGLYEHSNLAKKFAFRVDPTPVPSSDDFRCSVSQEDKLALETRIEEAEATAKADLWHRLASPLEAIASKLSEPDRANGQAPIFRDSLVGNLRDIVSLIPKLNLTQDAKLSDFARECESLSTVKPDSLRASKSHREQTAAAARAILDRMSGYLPTTR